MNKKMKVFVEDTNQWELIDAGGIFTSDEQTRFTGDDIAQLLDGIGDGESIPITNTFDENMAVTEFPYGRSIFLRDTGVEEYVSDRDQKDFIMVLTVVVEDPSEIPIRPDEPTSFQVAIMKEGRGANAYKVLRRSTRDNYRWNRWEDAIGIGDTSELRVRGVTLVGAINTLHEEQQKLFQSGVESNEILVDALNSKDVEASTGDDIESNAKKIYEITQSQHNIPLKPVTNLVGLGENESIELTWQSPDDIIHEGVLLTEFDYDVLVRSNTGIPTSIDDGTRVITATSNQYIVNGYKDTDIVYDKYFYYRVFSVAKNGTIVGGNGISIKVEKAIPLRFLPVGAKVVHPGTAYYDEDIVWTIIDGNHYDKDEVTLLSDDIITLRAFDAQEPDTAGYTGGRDEKGNNRYMYSNLRQWLNSDKDSWYRKTHSTDEPPVYDKVTHNDYEHERGFLANFPDSFKSKLVEVEVITLQNTMDGVQIDRTQDKVFILSYTELGQYNYSQYDEGWAFKYFNDGETKLKASVTRMCALKDDNDGYLTQGENWEWLTRTPEASPERASSLRIINKYGGTSKTDAYIGDRGVRPAVNIDSTVLVSPTPASDGTYTIQL